MLSSQVLGDVCSCVTCVHRHGLMRSSEASCVFMLCVLVVHNHRKESLACPNATTSNDYFQARENEPYTT